MVKALGIGCILISSAAAGLTVYRNVQTQRQQLALLLRLMEQFQRELSFHLTPIPTLFFETGGGKGEGVEGLFTKIGDYLSQKDGCTLQYAFSNALQNTQKLNLPTGVHTLLLDFSKEFGKLGIEESISGMEKTIYYLKEEQNRLCAFSRDRLKCVVTLLLCTGLALAVILI